jgi:hypothetical protein
VKFWSAHKVLLLVVVTVIYTGILVSDPRENALILFAGEAFGKVVTITLLLNVAPKCPGVVPQVDEVVLVIAVEFNGSEALKESLQY